MLPRGAVEQLPVVLQGARAELVSPLLGVLEGTAAGIDERRERRIVDEQIVALPDAVPQPLGAPGGLHGGLAGLLRETGHEEQVEPAAAVLEGGGQGALDGLVGVTLAEGHAHGLVIGVGGELDAPSASEGAVAFLEVLGVGSVEQFDDEMVVWV